MSLPYRPLTRRARAGVAVLASLAVHALVVPWLFRDFDFSKGPRQMAVSLVPGLRGGQPGQRPSRYAVPTPGLSKLAPRTPEELAAQQAEEKKRREEELAAQKQQPVRIDGQIVSLGPPKDERPPVEPTHYLSEHDSRVLKETRARETSAFFKNALSRVQREGKQERVDDTSRHGEHAPAEAPLGVTQAPLKPGGGQVAQAPSFELPRRAQQDRLQLQISPDGTVQNRTASDRLDGLGRRLAMAHPSEMQGSAQAEGSGPGAPASMPGLPNGRFPQLKLTLDNPLEALGPIAGGPMPDHLPNVEEGEETLLNSRSFRYAGYLNRVKETVGRIWTTDVQDVAQRRDPTGQTYSYKDRRTVVEFTLDRKGDICDVKLQSSSGVEFLDRVAVEAFRKAERFPNPPPGLVGEQGIVTLPFAFTLLAATGGAHISVGPAYLPASPALRGY
jgi:TonB family protein